MAHIETKEVQHQTHLDSTVKLLTDDLSEVAARAGLDNHFQRWIEELKDANNPAFHALIVDMQALKATFGSGHPDLDLVGNLLARLGQHTTEAAEFATGNTRPRVQKLGEVLTGVAGQLRGGAAPDGNLPQDMSSHSH